jgi:hypothetical protein
LLCFPSSFFFGALYTEGLFFLHFVLSLYCLERGNYKAAMLFGALSSATRLMGIFLFIPFAFHFIQQKQLSHWKKYVPDLAKRLGIICAPFVGFMVYSLYLWVTTRDPLFFLHAQPAFGANRSSHLILLPQVYFRYFKIVITAAHDYQWFSSLFEMAVFSGVAAVLLWDFVSILKRGEKVRLGLSLFSLINLILPTFTGTFSSITRYSLFSISFFIILARLPNRSLKLGIAFLFALGHLLLLGLFIQGYFVG